MSKIVPNLAKTKFSITITSEENLMDAQDNPIESGITDTLRVPDSHIDSVTDLHIRNQNSKYKVLSNQISKYLESNDKLLNTRNKKGKNRTQIYGGEERKIDIQKNIRKRNCFQRCFLL